MKSFRPSGKSSRKVCQVYFLRVQRNFGRNKYSWKLGIFCRHFRTLDDSFSTAWRKLFGRIVTALYVSNKQLEDNFFFEKTNTFITFGNRATKYRFPKRENWQLFQNCSVHGNILQEVIFYVQSFNKFQFRIFCGKFCAFFEKFFWGFVINAVLHVQKNLLRKNLFWKIIYVFFIAIGNWAKNCQVL